MVSYNLFLPDSDFPHLHCSACHIPQVHPRDRMVCVSPREVQLNTTVPICSTARGHGCLFTRLLPDFGREGCPWLLVLPITHGCRSSIPWNIGTDATNPSGRAMRSRLREGTAHLVFLLWKSVFVHCCPALEPTRVYPFLLGRVHLFSGAALLCVHLLRSHLFSCMAKSRYCSISCHSCHTMSLSSSQK